MQSLPSACRIADFETRRHQDPPPQWTTCGGPRSPPPPLLARPFVTSGDCTSGDVAAALVTGSGTLYTGVCIDLECGIGFCAEHAAVAEMLKVRESVVRMIVAVNCEGTVLPPCGRCRELLWQVDPR